MLVTILIYLLLGAFIPLVSNTGHVGGLVGGFLAAFVFLVPPRRPSRLLGAWRVATLALFCGLTFLSLIHI